MLRRGEAREAAGVFAFSLASGVEALSRRTCAFENPSDSEEGSGNLGHWCLWKAELRKKQGKLIAMIFAHS